MRGPVVRPVISYLPCDRTEREKTTLKSPYLKLDKMITNNRSWRSFVDRKTVISIMLLSNIWKGTITLGHLQFPLFILTIGSSDSKWFLLLENRHWYGLSLTVHVLSSSCSYKKWFVQSMMIGTLGNSSTTMKTIIMLLQLKQILERYVIHESGSTKWWGKRDLADTKNKTFYDQIWNRVFGSSYKHIFICQFTLTIPICTVSIVSSRFYHVI